MATGIGISLFFYHQGKSAFMLAEIEAKSRQATEAQLKLLQSQLDPHMLFNTLANLRALIGQEPDRAIQMLDQLGDFLRATLSASRAQEHSLAAEFDRLRDYLDLMHIRLGDRLRYTMDLPPQLAQIQVPTLILQSLVENAVLHGIEPKVGGGQVWISAAQQSEQLVLTVADDGAGFAAKTGADQSSSGFGIAQVRERLRSRYGPLATINIIAFYADSMRANRLFDLHSEAHHPALDAALGATHTPGCQVTLRWPIRP